MLLRYVAAVLDEHGAADVPAIARTAEPNDPVLDKVFARIDRRGFTGRFLHLLLDALYWFPFERDLILEAPDWRGDIAKLGSLARLAIEVAELRAAIAAADPASTAWSAERDVPQNDVLASAWQASDTVARLCSRALKMRLPLWTTG